MPPIPGSVSGTSTSWFAIPIDLRLGVRREFPRRGVCQIDVLSLRRVVFGNAAAVAGAAVDVNILAVQAII